MSLEDKGTETRTAFNIFQDLLEIYISSHIKPNLIIIITSAKKMLFTLPYNCNSSILAVLCH